jgi:hypothetical protein
MKKLMLNNYGIKTNLEDNSIYEYFGDYVQNGWFNYNGFIKNTIRMHIPDNLNENLIQYYSVLY